MKRAWMFVAAVVATTVLAEPALAGGTRIVGRAVARRRDVYEARRQVRQAETEVELTPGWTK